MVKKLMMMIVSWGSNEKIRMIRQKTMAMILTPMPSCCLASVCVDDIVSYSCLETMYFCTYRTSPVIRTLMTAMADARLMSPDPPYANLISVGST